MRSISDRINAKATKRSNEEEKSIIALFKEVHASLLLLPEQIPTKTAQKIEELIKLYEEDCSEFENKEKIVRSNFLDLTKLHFTISAVFFAIISLFWNIESIKSINTWWKLFLIPLATVCFSCIFVIIILTLFVIKYPSNTRVYTLDVNPTNNTDNEIVAFDKMLEMSNIYTTKLYDAFSKNYVCQADYFIKWYIFRVPHILSFIYVIGLFLILLFLFLASFL